MTAKSSCSWCVHIVRCSSWTARAAPLFKHKLHAFGLEYVTLDVLRPVKLSSTCRVPAQCPGCCHGLLHLSGIARSDISGNRKCAAGTDPFLIANGEFFLALVWTGTAPLRARCHSIPS